jgi:serine protease
MSRLRPGVAAAALVLPALALACREAFQFSHHHALLSPRAYSTLSVILWGLGLTAAMLFTVRGRGRTGFFPLISSPAFLGAAMLATTGAFFLKWLPVGPVLRFGLSLPLPDMDQLLFGGGTNANPLFYSALIPGLISLVGVRLPGARRLVAGLCCGFAGSLAAAAWHGWPELSVLSERWASVPWLAANAVVCLFIARAMMVAEQRRGGAPV